MNRGGRAGRARRHAGESFPRPRRALSPVLGSVVAIGAWAAVAHNSGAGWVQALGALLVGFLAVGLLAPGVVVRRARYAVVASPGDAVARRPAHLTVAVSSPVAVRPLYPRGPEHTTGRYPACQIPLDLEHRGVVTTCVIQLASAAPFGLMWWTKRVTLELPRPIHVAPPPGAPGHSGFVDNTSAGDDVSRTDRRVGDSRGVRHYQPGDLRHWIHWPSTAHTGSLMVREMEGPAARPLTVRAILPHDLEAADDAAQRAVGTVEAILSSGRSVILITAEEQGEVHGPVATVTEAGRRLARAVPQRPPPARPGPRGRVRPPSVGVPSDTRLLDDAGGAR